MTRRTPPPPRPKRPLEPNPVLSGGYDATGKQLAAAIAVLAVTLAFCVGCGFVLAEAL